MALNKSVHAQMVARLGACRMATTRLGVILDPGNTKTYTVGNPSRNIAWIPIKNTDPDVVGSSGWMVDKS